MEKISIIGVGKLGLCLSLNLESKNYNVLGCDVNSKHINELNNKSFLSDEPKVSEMLKNSKNINFTVNFNECIDFSDIIFLMVATPSLSNGKYDHSQIEAVISQLKMLGKQPKRKSLIIGCTTYPTYCESLVNQMNDLNFDVLYNPEFIAQGNIINGQLYPDLILIGETNKSSGDKLEEISKKLCNNTPKISRMSLTEAELTKLSINCFITTKISFANMIGDICNKLKISNNKVLEAIGSDSRIGGKYLKWGYGYGGPCFPRDNKALGILSMENGIIPSISNASDEYNNHHLKYQLEFIIKNIIDNKITLKGVTYKPDTVLIDESQQLKMAVELANIGVKVTIVDVESVINNVKKIYDKKFNYEIKS